MAVLLFVVFAATLYFIGQVPICKCGYVKLWHSVVFSAENSQHLSDWYSFSHIIHGLVFFGIAWLISRRWKLFSLRAGFLIALLAEMAWEIFENTDFIINRYREVTISLDYYGDSIINSVFDVLFMILGFFLARKLPVWATILFIIAMEVFVGFYIRDNLTLNIIMLIYPFKAILNWQTGG